MKFLGHGFQKHKQTRHIASCTCGWL